ncbi:MAG: hypothetical protein JSV51_09330 [Candidatus Bathyarchaeota archaeon]|nr:MAG: hypothetical protein JSV51_09330 [Candidatus Bathyarchaeota archaeon]
MNRNIKFWLLFLLGVCVFIPFFLMSIMFPLQSPVSIYRILFSLSSLGPFIIYCYIAYHSVYKGKKPKYPIVPPEGRPEIYFPRTDIPRPIHEDERKHSVFFKRKKMRKYGRLQRKRRKKEKD